MTPDKEWYQSRLTPFVHGAHVLLPLRWTGTPHVLLSFRWTGTPQVSPEDECHTGTFGGTGGGTDTERNVLLPLVVPGRYTTEEGGQEFPKGVVG